VVVDNAMLTGQMEKRSRKNLWLLTLVLLVVQLVGSALLSWLFAKKKDKYLMEFEGKVRDKVWNEIGLAYKAKMDEHNRWR